MKTAKRILALLFVLSCLMSFGVATAENTPYEIDATDITFSNEACSITKWIIDGAEVKEVKKQGGTGPDSDITYDVVLENGTPMDAELNIGVVQGEKGSPAVSAVQGNTLNVSKSYNSIWSNGHSITLSEGNISTQLYLYKLPNYLFTCTFNFSIAAPDTSNDPLAEDVTGIAVTTPPYKTEYLAGSRFDPAGMAVTATLKSGDTAPVAGYEISPGGALGKDIGEITISYAGFTATQAVTVQQGAEIERVTISNGQLFGDYKYLGYQQYAKKTDEYGAAVLYGEATGNFQIKVEESLEIYIGDEEQAVTDGVCDLSLPASVEGTTTVVQVRQKTSSRDYTFTCYSQVYGDMPAEITEYLCIASQYTNGNGLQLYGLNPISTLLGDCLDASTGGMAGSKENSPTSLGNFGGYIVYRYDEPIPDNPNNPYGIDFIVYSNSYGGTPGFAEPGNVLVSEDGDTWYTLAGAVHYNDNAVWDYSITYQNQNGRAVWADSRGGGGISYFYPEKEKYPLFAWADGLESEITLTGTLLLPDEGLSEYKNMMPPYPHFGYADVGIRTISNAASNPYTGLTLSGRESLTDRPDGFDLKWAVNENGQPVDVSGKQFHYVKIQTANNIDNGGIGEKSTEVNGMRLAASSASTVGITGAPAGITVDRKDVTVTGENLAVVNGVEVSGPFVVNVDAPAGANVYINGSRGTSATFAKIPNHEMLRIIVQEGEKEPWIGYLNLVEGEPDENDKYTVITFDPTGGTMADAKERTYMPEMPEADKVFPIPAWEDRKFLGWFDEDGKQYTGYTEDMPAALTLTAKWEYILKPGEPKTVDVTFRLIGAGLSNGVVDLGKPEAGYRGSEYITWIPTGQYTMNKGDTMYELFIRALADAGLASRGAEDNYVEAITAPGAHGGYELAEFTNGPRSGWMYTVGRTASAAAQKHPSRGLLQYDLQDGDVVIWHYVNDYAYEVADWDTLGGSEYPSQGNGTYWNRWLLASDVTPTEDNKPSGGTEGGVSAITPEVTLINGKASSNVSKDDIDAAIKAAEKYGTTNIKIDAKTTQSVTKSSVTLPSGSASDMAKAGMSVSVETSTGNFDIDNDALKAIAAKGGGSVELSAERLGTDDLSDANKELVGDHPVFDLSITVGNTKVTDFGDGAVTVSLPYTPADKENTDNLTVYYIDSDGNAVKMEGAHYDKDTGSIIFKTDHFSTFAVVYEAALWTNPFTDVTTDDWFYQAVEFVASKDLFGGMTDTTFGPNAAMTRAMLVTVLYRLEEEPDVTADNLFTDVADDEWYTDAVIWASENKIIGGYGGGLFGTNDSITREQMATILYNYASYKDYDVTASADFSAYTDADGISTWAESAMQWASAEELINGVTETTLEPNGSATRAQVATIFMRFVENLVG